MNDFMKPSVLGIGYRGSDIKVTENGRAIPAYSKWKNMILRAYCPKYQERFPTYIGTRVCDEWLNFTEYKKWFDANYVEGWEPDKDLLISGNKLYSPETVIFLPKAINYLLNDHNAGRGEFPQGVSLRNKKFLVRFKMDGKLTRHGRFDCPVKAYNVYREAKLKHIKNVVARYDLEQWIVDAIIKTAHEKLPVMH